ncbi:MAG: hypothetical protein WC822_06575 [Candidatus Paceibacterota bacterium]|jgi:hypothetical protein
MMIGSHKVEDYIEWLKAQENFPIVTRTHLVKKMKDLADKASMTGKPTMLEITRKKEVVMKLRFFPDGSMDVGYPSDLKWHGGTPTPALIPTEKELV